VAIRALKLHVTEVVLHMIGYNVLHVVQLLADEALPEGPAVLGHNFDHVLIDGMIQKF